MALVMALMLLFLCCAIPTHAKLTDETIVIPANGDQVCTLLPLIADTTYHLTLRSPYDLRELFGYFHHIYLEFDGRMPTREQVLTRYDPDHPMRELTFEVYGIGQPSCIRLTYDYSRELPRITAHMTIPQPFMQMSTGSGMLVGGIVVGTIGYLLFKGWRWAADRYEMESIRAQQEANHTRIRQEEARKQQQQEEEEASMLKAKRELIQRWADLLHEYENLFQPLFRLHYVKKNADAILSKKAHWISLSRAFEDEYWCEFIRSYLPTAPELARIFKIMVLMAEQHKLGMRISEEDEITFHQRKIEERKAKTNLEIMDFMAEVEQEMQWRAAYEARRKELEALPDSEEKAMRLQTLHEMFEMRKHIVQLEEAPDNVIVIKPE